MYKVSSLNSTESKLVGNVSSTDLVTLIETFAVHMLLSKTPQFLPNRDKTLSK